MGARGCGLRSKELIVIRRQGISGALVRTDFHDAPDLRDKRDLRDKPDLNDEPNLNGRPGMCGRRARNRGEPPLRTRFAPQRKSRPFPVPLKKDKPDPQPRGSHTLERNRPPSVPAGKSPSEVAGKRPLVAEQVLAPVPAPAVTRSEATLPWTAHSMPIPEIRYLALHTPADSDT